jgi:hypothetical protein
MDRLYKRPMFRKGGSADSAGTGITSGLQRPGYKVGERVTEVMDEMRTVMPQRAPKRNFNDFLINFGLDLASRPSAGPGFGGLLTTAAQSAKDPFAQFQQARAADSAFEDKLALGAYDTVKADQRAAKEFEQKKELVRLEGEFKSKSKAEIQAAFLDDFWDPLIAAETDPIKKKKLQTDKTLDKYKVTAYGFDISDKYSILKNESAVMEAQKMAEDQLVQEGIEKGTPTYNSLYNQYVGKYLNQITDSIMPKLPGEEGYYNPKKDGGRIGKALGGMTEDVNVEETVAAPQETNEINISYTQLRDRLPPEVTDDIALLLSESYEALADFAEIQTQADVNQFNTKYAVQLFLPQQTGV